MLQFAVFKLYSNMGAVCVTIRWCKKYVKLSMNCQW